MCIGSRTLARTGKDRVRGRGTLFSLFLKKISVKKMTFKEPAPVPPISALDMRTPFLQRFFTPAEVLEAWTPDTSKVPSAVKNILSEPGQLEAILTILKEEFGVDAVIDSITVDPAKNRSTMCFRGTCPACRYAHHSNRWYLVNYGDSTHTLMGCFHTGKKFRIWARLPF